MSASIKTEFLMNCTIMAINQFPETALVNETFVHKLNRPDLLNLLGNMISNVKDYNKYSSTWSIK